MRPVSARSAASIGGIVERRHRAFAQRLAVGIVGIGGDAEARDGVVGLARAEQAAGDLGRLAEADRQQAGGERIEAAGMAGLLGAEQDARTAAAPGWNSGPCGLSSSRMPSSVRNSYGACGSRSSGAVGVRCRSGSCPRRSGVSAWKRASRQRPRMRTCRRFALSSSSAGGGGRSRSRLSMRSPRSTESS